MDISQDETDVSSYRKTLFDISEGLTKSEVDKLIYLCKDNIPVAEQEGIRHARKLFNILERKSIISESNLKFLVKILKSVYRDDLCKKLQDFQTAVTANQNIGRPVQHSSGELPLSGLQDCSLDQGSPATGMLKSPAQFNLTVHPKVTPTGTLGQPAGILPSGVTTSMLLEPRLIDHGSKCEKASKSPAYGITPREQLSIFQAHPPTQSFTDKGSRVCSNAEAFGSPATNFELPLSHNTKSEFTKNITHKEPKVAKMEIDSSILLNKLSADSKDSTPHSDGSLTTSKESMPILDGKLIGEASHFIQPSPGMKDADIDADGCSSELKNQAEAININRGSDNAIVSEVKPSIQNSATKQLGNGNFETDSPSFSSTSAPPQATQDMTQTSVLSPGGIDPICESSPNEPESMIAAPTCTTDVLKRIEDKEKDGTTCQDETRMVILRQYQHELASGPLTTEDNYIICAPTGSGKTLTAASICYNKYQHFKPTDYCKYFKALFIVNLRHLKQQQRNAFQEYFPNKMAVRTLGDQQSLEDALVLDEAMPVVLMLTAQIFVNALKQKAVTIENLSMLIFDECHHTVLSHPYNQIMSMYLKKKASLSNQKSRGVVQCVGCLPQVLGLSASLGVGHGQSALHHVLELCASMNVQDVIRVRDNKHELDEFVKSPEQDAMLSVPPRVAEDRYFGKLLEDLMSKIQEQLGEGSSKGTLPLFGSQPYENAVIKCRQESSNHEDTMIYIYLNAYNRALMLYEDLPVQDSLQTLGDFHNSRNIVEDQEESSKEKYCRHLFSTNLDKMTKLADKEGGKSNHKLRKLIKLIEKQFTQDPTSKGIILTRMRIATTAICGFIRSSEHLKQSKLLVKPERLVGQQGPYEDHGMTESEQKMVLDNFRSRDGCNVLVATDIAQEGLDMPACNFVIRYNFVSNEIGTVQSKGRARAEGSSCFLIVESGSANEKRELENRDKVKEMEHAMNELEAMAEGERLIKIAEKQEAIIASMIRAEQTLCERSSHLSQDKTFIKCRECLLPVCKVADLRRKGAAGYVTCIDPNFMDRVEVFQLDGCVRYRDTQEVGIVKCGTPNCKMKLGSKQLFFIQKTESEGYCLRAKSFIAVFETGGEKSLKQWKQLENAGLKITEDADI